MPEADREDAVVVAVTAKGTVYYGITPVSPAELGEKIRGGLPGKRLYIKGDSRAMYDDVAKVLEAARRAGIEAPILLTAQRDSPEPVYPVPPKGLEVAVGPSLPSAAESIVVQVLKAGPGRAVKIGDERIPSDSVQATLERLFQKRSQRVVVLKTDEPSPFGEVVRVIDACRAAGGRVFLSRNSE